jgi:hypothetical protein
MEEIFRRVKEREPESEAYFLSVKVLGRARR